MTSFYEAFFGSNNPLGILVKKKIIGKLLISSVGLNSVRGFEVQDFWRVRVGS